MARRRAAPHEGMSPQDRAVMRQRVTEFVARNGLSEAARPQATAQSVIRRLGGPAGAVRALGHERGRAGSADRAAYNRTIRAFQRAVTGAGQRHEQMSEQYRRELERVATADERAALRGEPARGGQSNRVRWPDGAAVRVTVAGEYAYSEDERERDDLWAEIEGDDLEALMEDPWDAWETHLGVEAGGTDQPWGDGLTDAMRRVDDVQITWVSRGSGDDLGTF